MLRYMLFEDSPNSMFVNIVKHVYNGTDIIVNGASGGPLLFEKAYSYLMSTNDIVFAYLDFVPNNIATIGLYENICRSIITTNLYDRLALIPIPCAEFYMLKLYDEIAHMGGSVLVWDGINTYEQSCKNTVKNIECFKKKSTTGCRFWVHDCSLPNHDKVSLDQKKFRLVSLLPAYIGVQTKYGLLSSNLNVGLRETIDTCLFISDCIGANTNYCREVLNMNPLLNLE